MSSHYKRCQRGRPPPSDVKEILNLHAKILTLESSKRSESESNVSKINVLEGVDSCEHQVSLNSTEADETKNSDSDDNSFPEPISDDDLYSSDEENDQTPENVTEPAKRMRKSTLPDVFSETRDGIFMKKDNIAHFWSADYIS